MAAYNDNQNIADYYEKTKTFIGAWLGVIITVMSMVVVFFVASLEGTKEVKASNRLSGTLLTQWRTENNINDRSFPEEKVDIIRHKNKDYYFVVESLDEQGEILKWHFAYDAGIEYIFKDFKYYILVGITFMFSIFVANVNYNSSVEKAMSTENFKSSLLYYQKHKNAVENKTQYLPRFCSYKNKQTYQNEKRNIVESANIDWEKYNSDNFNKEKLNKNQKKKLKKIDKIKIVYIRSQDLLQEQNFTNKKIRILAESFEEHKKSFLIRKSATKLITTSLGGLVAGFGIVLGNWVLGLVLASTIIASAITSTLTGLDFGSNTLKNRFIGKGDLLLEYKNIYHIFEEEEKLEKEKKKQQELEEKRLKEEQVKKETKEELEDVKEVKKDKKMEQEEVFEKQKEDYIEKNKRSMIRHKKSGRVIIKRGVKNE